MLTGRVGPLCQCLQLVGEQPVFRHFIACQAGRTENVRGTEEGGLPSAFPVSTLFSLDGVGCFVGRVLSLKRGGPQGLGMVGTALSAPRLPQSLGSLAGLPLPSPARCWQGVAYPAAGLQGQTLLAPRLCWAGSWGREGSSELVSSCLAASEQQDRLGLVFERLMGWPGT